MPFTVAHVAAVLPATKAEPLRDPLVFSALAVGAMSPDIPYFVPADIWWAWGHSWTGLLIQDVPLTLALVALYWTVLAAPLRKVAPETLRRRLPQNVVVAHRHAPLRVIILMTLGAAAGAATHILWDAFTHEDRFGVMAVPWLQAPDVVGPLPAYRVLQYVSSLIGVVALVWAFIRWFRSAPVREASNDGISRAGKVVFATAVMAALAVGWWSARDLAVGMSNIYDWRLLLYTGLTRSVALAAVVIVVGATALRLIPASAATSASR
jgi:hypothetical protein